MGSTIGAGRGAVSQIVDVVNRTPRQRPHTAARVEFTNRQRGQTPIPVRPSDGSARDHTVRRLVHGTSEIELNGWNFQRITVGNEGGSRPENKIITVALISA
jgi:hypothetical protein